MDSEKDVAVAPPGWLRRKLEGFYRRRDAIKKDPVAGTVLFIVIAAIGFGASEAYGYAKEKLRDPDAYLVQMARTQEAEFATLNQSLRDLSNSLDSSEGRRELGSIKGAVAGIESQNRDLLRMLALSKRENARIAQLAEARSGIHGGYDFLLTENSGVRLDSMNVLGVSNISGTQVIANISGPSAPSDRKYLRSGQGIDYRGADGRECSVSLLSIENGDSAAFAVACG
ncbi:hypothetical protein [Luteimonas terrae]|uniref:Uncharacterized protein n=1 Tax=Luteimonas terrae TaxID=1530191 RepID=A0A4R5UDS1_9GAMM|nr:hypothetical protein [Luteimonas terrae]TDK33331.1 hypothetical protein E2F49_04690 [Luteimonas terrae]